MFSLVNELLKTRRELSEVKEQLRLVSRKKVFVQLQFILYVQICLF